MRKWKDKVIANKNIEKINQGYCCEKSATKNQAGKKIRSEFLIVLTEKI